MPTLTLISMKPPGRRALGLGAFALAIVLAALAPRPAAAFIAPHTKQPGQGVDPSDPYQATTLVTGYDMRSRPAGFAICLRQVLVKASGETRLEKDSRVSALTAHAGRFVAAFDYADQMAGIPVHDDQGTYDRPYYLTVHFVPAKIDAALAKLGARPWRGPRPTVVPVIAMRGFTGHYLLAEDEERSRDQRLSLLNAAAQYGASLRVPSRAMLAEWNVTLDGLPAPRADPKPNEAVVAGTLTFDEAKPGWVGHWLMRWRGRNYRWGIAGVNYDAAFRDIFRGVTRIASGHRSPD